MSDKKLSVWRCPECGETEQSRNGRVDRWTRNTRYGYEPHPRHWHGEVGTALHRYVPAEEVEVIPVSAPNVLSVVEAAMVASPADFPLFSEDPLRVRLREWLREDPDA